MTISVLVMDVAHGVAGVGTASRSLAVGNAVPAVDPRFGVAVTQAWTNRSAGRQLLASLADGSSVEAAVRSTLAMDLGAAFRQLAVIDREGQVAVHTGSECSAHAAALTGPGWAVVGNLVASHEVVKGAARMLSVPTQPLTPTYRRAIIGLDGEANHQTVPPEVGRLGARLVATLRAAEQAGGDRRGRQSAALRVVQLVEPGASSSSTATDIDLRVDDHPDPIGELDRLLDLLLYGPTADPSR